MIGVSDFKGGEIWVEGEGGSSVQVVEGKRLHGHLLPITARPTYIHAYRDMHFTMPWKGKRLVIIAFSVSDHLQAQSEDLAILRGQGFVLPGEEASDLQHNAQGGEEASHIQHLTRSEESGAQDERARSRGQSPSDLMNATIWAPP